MVEARNGIYFGLDEAAYHADPALGSSSMKQLAYSPPDYWFNSPYNPTRMEKESTAAQILGTAYHKMVLEGGGEFLKRYGIKREKWNTKAGFAERDRFAEVGLIPIDEDDWIRIQLAGAVISANPHLAQAFTGGISEVSVFWRAGGVPKKCRIDHLKTKASVDLKTIAPQDGLEFPDACRRAMANFHYAVQAEHYNEGRMALVEFASMGLIHGDHDRDLLDRIAASPTWVSVFVFLKKSGAPLTYGCSISPENPLLAISRQTIMKATENYKLFSERFGFDTPWLTNDPLEEISVDDYPAWFRTL